ANADGSATVLLNTTGGLLVYRATTASMSFLKYENLTNPIADLATNRGDLRADVIYTEPFDGFLHRMTFSLTDNGDDCVPATDLQHRLCRFTGDQAIGGTTLVTNVVVASPQADYYVTPVQLDTNSFAYYRVFDDGRFNREQPG